MSNQRIVSVPVAAALLAALLTGVARVRQEAAHRAVAPVVDYGEVGSLAAYAQRPVGAVLERLKGAGLVAVAVEEPLARDLADAGVLRVQAGPGGSLTLHGNTPHGAAAVARLAARWHVAAAAGSATLHAPWSAVMDAGCGVDAEAVAAVRAAGLTPVARLRNTPGLGLAEIESELAAAAALGVKAVLFSGDQVLGYRALTAATGAGLSSHKLVWGRVEFAEQKGDDRLAEALLSGGNGSRPPQTYLRVHSVTTGEMHKMSPEMAVERYRRAAVERGIRLLFVRLLLSPSEDILQANAEHLRRLQRALVQAHLATRWPVAWPPVGLPRGLLLLLGLGGVLAPTAAALVLLSGGWSTRRWLGWWLMLSVPCVALAVARPLLCAKGLALLAGLLWPTAGGRWAWARVRAGRVRTLPAAFGVVWGAVGLAVLGGLLAAALLTQSRFLLHHSAFMGVKLTQVVPLCAVGLILVTDLSLPGVSLADARRRLAETVRRPVLSWHLLLGAVALVLLALLVVRSGNEGLEVSSTEMRFRALLEGLFGARPRTKELFFGEPALLLAALAALRGRPDLARWLLAAGMVGVVSAFNTFCHLHTPLTQSLLRTFHALWLGSLLGWLVGARLWRHTDAEEADG